MGVPKGLPRIRFFISARHKEEDIDRTVGALDNFLCGPSRRRAAGGVSDRPRSEFPESGFS